jgi:hypothetical protein
MVDKSGLSNVLWALAHISRAKAHHIEGNLQGKHTAKTWMCDALKISRSLNVWGIVIGGKSV